MLFLLLLAAACAASNGPGFPLCKTAGWKECVTDRAGISFGRRPYREHACVTCEVRNESVVSGSPDPFSLLPRVNVVAIKGYPFHVLSAKTLAPLDDHVTILALIDAKITDVKNNTFVGVVGLGKLSLASNRLTTVKKTWFSGLERLLVLILFNNNIKQIEPGSFMHLTRLHVLDLENNLLQVVDPAWLFGLKGSMILNLRLNEINSISPGSFQDITLTWLDLTDNDLSCLDGEVLWGQSWLAMLHISSGMLSSVHDAEPHGMMWSLHRLASMMRGSATLFVSVPKFLFCARHNAHELLFGWMFDSSSKVTGNIDVSRVNPGRSCGALDSSLTTISVQTPVVVLATDGSLTDALVPNTLEQCRQVWEYHGGIAVALVEHSIFRLVSMATGNAAFEGVAITFVKSQGTDTLTTTESEHSQKHVTHANTTLDNTKNISCVLVTKDEYTKLFFTVPPVQRQTHTTATTYRADTVLPSTIIHNTPSEQGDNSTLQVGTTPGPKVRPSTDHVLISVVVSAGVSLVVSLIVVLVWKLCAARSNAGDGRASDDAHIWTIPPGVAFPGLLRSASLPVCSTKVASDDAASCRSLPAVIHSIEPTYCEIPDDVAAAHRPLPGLPQWEIPDDGISSVARSSSLPAVTCTRGGAEDDLASCRSLPAVLLPIEPTYSQIPDHLAIAQRPLPALPRTHWETPDNEAAARRPIMPARQHTYSEIPDDESGPMPFYADAAEFSLHVVTNRRPNRRAFRDNTTTTCSRQSGRSFAPYGSADPTKAQSNNFYRKAPEVQGLRARRNLRTALASRAADQGVRTYVNVTDAILSRGQNVTEAHIAFLTYPDAHLPWEIPGEGTRNTSRRTSLPHVTLPNTYWPWEIPGEGTRNTPRRTSLPHVTLPNTYWPWEIPGEGTRNTPRRTSLPHVTLPNTYWPWEIPGEGTRNTSRRTSLPHVTLPNTYWPWDIPGREPETHHGVRPVIHHRNRPFTNYQNLNP
ncbi:LRIG3 [Branchiostoma lanceolatum]|uniref:LRIG3 protein n=1 Tax=Branchiostoma lanceolatum TaxID=7740 RepID=A0A8K0E598_BRALA|nr:LRIG3 [Branchiostoma lanceolatum]